MISFKLSQDTHANLSKALKKLTWIGYFLGLTFFAYTGLQGYLRATEIMSNHGTVDAELVFEGTTVKHKKRRDVTTYHFQYHFTVDGQEYSKPFSASESNADKYLDVDTIAVAYSKTDPNNNETLSKLQSDSDFMSWLKRFLVIIPVLGFLAFAIYMLMTKRLFVVRQEVAARA